MRLLVVLLVLQVRLNRREEMLRFVVSQVGRGFDFYLFAFVILLVCRLAACRDGSNAEIDETEREVD